MNGPDALEMRCPLLSGKQTPIGRRRKVGFLDLIPKSLRTNQAHRSPCSKRQRFDHPHPWGLAYGCFGSKSMSALTLPAQPVARATSVATWGLYRSAIRLVWSICGKLAARHFGGFATLSARRRHRSLYYPPPVCRLYSWASYQPRDAFTL